MESWIEELTYNITPLDESLLSSARKRIGNPAKSIEQMDILRELGRRFIAISSDPEASVKKKMLFVFAADHGVAEEGPIGLSKNATIRRVHNLLEGEAKINMIAKHTKSDITVIDIGVADFLHPHPGIFHAKVRMGTDNMAKGAAMSREDALESIRMGVEAAFSYAAKDYNLFAAADTGIRNPAPGSAILSAITGKPPEEVIGQDPCINTNRVNQEAEIARKALEVNRPDPSDPIDLLSKVGSLEIGGIAGLILGSATLKIPVALDGLTSTTGALIAAALCHKVKDYVLCTQKPASGNHVDVLVLSDRIPLLDQDKHLEEGTRAILGMWIMELGEKIIHDASITE